MTGRGHHRVYDRKLLPFVALAIELGRWGLSLKIIRNVLFMLHERNTPEWRAALAGETDIYLVIQIPERSMSPFAFHRVTKKSDLLDKLDGKHERFLSAVVVSLSKLFSRL